MCLILMKHKVLCTQIEAYSLFRSFVVDILYDSSELQPFTVDDVQHFSCTLTINLPAS